MTSLKKLKLRWHKELKQYLMGDLGISWCESCGRSDQLSIAHAKKQRFITDRTEYFRAAILCLDEHRDLDEGKRPDPHQYMDDFISRLIAERE